ncbi:MAG: hypothetical protein K9H48_21685 [Melioribacteraceae bacterium]|nr:hypothetical protein [Melioribacteraceae bacterium]MCF8396512.1 hypothetical protein [Melioribacteraceae bacterium]
MKTRSNNKVKRTLMTIAAVLLLTVAVNAQATQEVKISENAVSNLVQGIKSENPGLSRSAIYFAGKYRITQTVDAMKEKLENVKDASTQLLIARALFEIGTYEAIEVISELAQNSDESKVRSISTALVLNYLGRVNEKLVNVGF